ncbi:MAG: cytochrome P450 [Pseudomonadota bacterium]
MHDTGFTPLMDSQASAGAAPRKPGDAGHGKPALPVSLFKPPRPKSLGPLSALLRAAITRNGNLIGLLPKQAYKMAIGNLGYSRRSIVIVNDPGLVRTILTDPTNIYPKNDLMVGALAPLVGDSVFVSSGPPWKRQRAMISPAFTHMKLDLAFKAMEAAGDDFDATLKARAKTGENFSLDLAMSHLTADVICRTVFSTSLASDTAKEVYESFSLFERSVAHVEIRRLIMDPPWTDIPQHKSVLDACERIRTRLGELVDRHLRPDAKFKDIATDIIKARDAQTGEGFNRKELIDQLGVFFLAGHETTASALTWAFYVLGTRADIRARLRQEIEDVTGGEPLNFTHIRKLHFATSIFKEAMRLYPPITFIPRVAACATRIGKKKIKKGAMIMIAPWVIHRHEKYWKNPDHFDAERFMPHREKEIMADAYMPFGLGPRVCVGANFATIEATYFLARFFRDYDFEIEAPEEVTPVARLTCRPQEQVEMRVQSLA